MKRPSFQFYPSDWLRDTALRSCSTGARGLWIDMICYMHEGNPYGYLKVGDKVILPPNLARMCGLTTQEVEGWLEELEEAGVYEVDEEGAIFSRRMIRDENLRAVRAAGGKLGGNPNLKDNHKVNLKDKPKVQKKDKQKPTPSSSSSSSSSNPPNPPEGDGVEQIDVAVDDMHGCAEFWKTWPSGPRKAGMVAIQKKWVTRELAKEADEILAHLRFMKETDDWKRGFAPAPMTYINQQRWKDGIPKTGEDDTFAGVM